MTIERYSDNFKMMEGKAVSTKKSFSLDWLMRGVLTKFGETFDKLTGRNWKPSSSLATSELIERLKLLLDSEAQIEGDKKFVPHKIKLKMQWDKFSTDSEKALKKLENELLIAAIDFINDKRFHTFAPMELQIKPDYFTEGVKLSASFDKFGEDEEREAAINVSVPDLKNVVINPPPEIPAEPEKIFYVAEFVVRDKTVKKELAFAPKQRLSVGRARENDLWIDDGSVSKLHAALVLNSDAQLMVADTGSTNGTFVNNQRIAYGKAILLSDGDNLKFGTVDVALEHIIKEVEAENHLVGQTSFDENAPETSPAEEKSFDKNTVLIRAEDDGKQTEQGIVLDLSENG
ncbi:MAG: FHA domain-containing protein [Pyrinomonadaceae bacterium]